MAFEEIRKLREEFGDTIELSDDDGQDETFRIISELLIDEVHYCMLRPLRVKKDEDDYLFKVIEEATGLTVAPIEDEEEWETVSESYDDWLFEQEQNH